MFDDAKVEVIKKCGYASEEADAPDAGGFGLIEKGVDEQTAGAVPFGVGMDGDRTDFGQVLAVDVERSTTDELAGAGFDDGEGLDVLADFGVGAVQEGVVVGETVDQLMDCMRIVQLRFTRVQRGCFKLAFGRDKGDRE